MGVQQQRRHALLVVGVAFMDMATGRGAVDRLARQDDERTGELRVN